MSSLTRILLFIVAGIFSSALFAQNPKADPVTLVEKTATVIFADVAENMEHYQANPEALQDLVRVKLLPLLDVDYSSRLILGRAGRGIENAKIEEFRDCMSNLLVNRYSKGLLYFNSDVKLRVLPQRGKLNEKLTRVRSRVTLPSGAEAPVDYAFHKTPEGWKAFDLVVEGISYVTTFRNQIMPDVQANGIDSVIARLGTGELELSD